MQLILAASLVWGATSGCAAPMAVDGGEPAGACETSAAQSLVGQRKSEALGVDAMKRTGTSTIRWIAPGQPVSMDYRTDRLNIELDDQERIIRVTCG